MKNENKIVLYTIAEKNVSVNVMYADETFWLTQRAMGELFSVEIPTISEHLKNIYSSNIIIS